MPIAIIKNLFIECPANALGHSPNELPFDHFWNEYLPRVVYDDVFQDLHLTYLKVHLHSRDVGGVCEGTRVR